MKDELEQKLYEKYPKIFGYVKEENQMAPINLFGIECGDGWFDIIDLLCFNIQQYLEKHNDVSQLVVTQIKEKFGELRFYSDGGDIVTDKLIDYAEDLSIKICEKCGNKGKIRGGRWMVTLCDSCNRR